MIRLILQFGLSFYLQKGKKKKKFTPSQVTEFYFLSHFIMLLKIPLAVVLIIPLIFYCIAKLNTPLIGKGLCAFLRSFILKKKNTRTSVKKQVTGCRKMSC